MCVRLGFVNAASVLVNAARRPMVRADSAASTAVLTARSTPGKPVLQDGGIHKCRQTTTRHT